MELNTIIKRKTGNREKERELLDELINQMETESADPIAESPPIEITEQVKAKMLVLTDEHWEEELGCV